MAPKRIAKSVVMEGLPMKEANQSANCVLPDIFNPAVMLQQVALNARLEKVQVKALLFVIIAQRVDILCYMVKQFAASARVVLFRQMKESTGARRVVKVSISQTTPQIMQARMIVLKTVKTAQLGQNYPILELSAYGMFQLPLVDVGMMKAGCLYNLRKKD